MAIKKVNATLVILNIKKICLLLWPFCGFLIATSVHADTFATLIGKVDSLETQPVVIYLEPVSKVKAVDTLKPVHSSLSSRGSVFKPAFQVMQVGTVLEIQNNDEILHNTHISKNKITLFNVATPLKNTSVRKIMPRTGIFDVVCDLHSWMNARVAVIDSPYYSVLWKSGDFQIDNIPAGQYRLHSLQAEKDEIITVLNLKQKSTKHISF